MTRHVIASMLALCISSNACATFGVSSICNARSTIAYFDAIASADFEAVFKEKMAHAQALMTSNKNLNEDAMLVWLAIAGAPLVPIGAIGSNGSNGGQLILFLLALSVSLFVVNGVIGIGPTFLASKRISHDVAAMSSMYQVDHIPFICRLLRSPVFQEEVGFNPCTTRARISVLIKLMEKIGVGLQIGLSTSAFCAALYAFLFRRSVKAGASLLGLSYFCALPLKQIILAMWRPIAKIPRVRTLNRAIAQALTEQDEWRAIFAQEDAEAAGEGEA